MLIPLPVTLWCDFKLYYPILCYITYCSNPVILCYIISSSNHTIGLTTVTARAVVVQAPKPWCDGINLWGGDCGWGQPVHIWPRPSHAHHHQHHVTSNTRKQQYPHVRLRLVSDWSLCMGHHEMPDRALQDNQLYFLIRCGNISRVIKLAPWSVEPMKWCTYLTTNLFNRWKPHTS